MGIARDRGARRVPGAGPGAVRPLLRPDAGAVLLPGRHLGRAEPDVGGAEDGHLHARRLAADARRRGRDGGAQRAGPGRADLRALGPAAQPAPGDDAALGLRRLRARLPDQDAGVPVPRLDARRLPATCRCRRSPSSPAWSPRSPPTASCASCCRCSRCRSHDWQTILLRARAAVDPLRLDPRLHADQRAPDPRLLVGRAARLHHARDLRARRAGDRRPGRAAAGGQPRARRRAAVLHRDAARRAHRGSEDIRDMGGIAFARARARRAVPDRDASRRWRCRARRTSSASS